MSASLTALVVYAIGFLVMMVAFSRLLEKQYGPLDGGDIGFVLFAALGWPILAPFAALIWAAKTLLPLFGVEVRK